MLRLTGVCDLHLTEERRRLGKTPGNFSLQLGSLDRIAIITPAPWWNRARLLGALGAASVAALLAAGWALTVARANARLRAEIFRREQAEEQLANDRRRVAGDLHDTLEQTLIAAGLQLNAAKRTIEVQPESAAARIALAHQLVARGRQEVRDAVWDLHAGEDQQHTLGAMLGRACAEAASSAAAEVSFSAEGEEPPLPALIVAQGVRLVREAVTNALKHGKPAQVSVTLKCDPAQLKLSVADDGGGFDAAAAAGPETGHFGLANMRERVQRLGGTLTVDSAAGRGTTVIADIPIPSS
jgi:signal transduction histidine kinase